MTRDPSEAVDLAQNGSEFSQEARLAPGGRPRSWRSRKYRVPARKPSTVSEDALGNMEPAQQLEVLISGPLQRRFLGFAWRWRWCVLDSEHLSVYWNEAHYLADPTEPLESYKVGTLVVCSESFEGASDTFRCMFRESGATALVLRGGDGELWEEIAAAHLWVNLLNVASRVAGVEDKANLGPATSKISDILWHENVMGF